MTKHIVVVEDERMVGEFLRLQLEKAGYTVSCAETVAEAKIRVVEDDPALILLDLNLPDEDGLVFARQVRTTSNVPIIVLTGRKDDDSRVTGYEIGVDDYIPKNTDANELLVRVRNVLRRSSGGQSVISRAGAEEAIRHGRWTIDLEAHALIDEAGAVVDLTSMEFRILAVFAQAPNRVLSRGQLIDAVATGKDPPQERTIDAFVGRLRRKMGSDCPIKTVKGFGYRFDTRPSSG